MSVMDDAKRALAALKESPPAAASVTSALRTLIASAVSSDAPAFGEGEAADKSSLIAVLNEICLLLPSLSIPIESASAIGKLNMLGVITVAKSAIPLIIRGIA